MVTEREIVMANNGQAFVKGCPTWSARTTCAFDMSRASRCQNCVYWRKYLLHGAASRMVADFEANPAESVRCAHPSPAPSSPSHDNEKEVAELLEKRRHLERSMPKEPSCPSDAQIVGRLLEIGRRKTPAWDDSLPDIAKLFDDAERSRRERKPERGPTCRKVVEELIAWWDDKASYLTLPTGLAALLLIARRALAAEGGTE